MASGTPSNLSLGENVIIAGLAIQLLFFSFFIFAAAMFHRRIHANPTTAALSEQFSWRNHLLGLYAASVLIMVRSIFRVAEYVQGTEGELLRRELYLYIFDAALMFLLMALLNVVHPGEISLLLRESKGSADLEMRPKKGRRNRSRKGSSRENETYEPVSLVDTTYARHAIATRDLA